MLDDLRVVDLSTEIAGPYCTKLLADAGADVVKVEPPGGDPLRRWRSGALFKFLNTSKRSIVGDLGGDEVRDLIAAADIVVEDGGGPGRPERPQAGPGRPERPQAGRGALGVATLEVPGLVVVSISPFGLAGPWADRAATEFVLQAWCGSTGSRGTRDRPPVAAGGRLGEWIGGAYAAVGGVAAWKQARLTGRGEHVDVSLLECMSMTMNTFTSVFASFMGRPPVRGPARTIEIPSVEPTRDGYVGFCTITAQQFQDFLVLIERPDLIDDRDLASAIGRSKRMDEILAVIHDWTTKRTSDEIIELATLLRIPVTPVGNGATLPTLDHFRARGTFVEHPGGGFVQPRVPYAVGGHRGRPFTPAPRLGEHSGAVGGRRARRWRRRGTTTSCPSTDFASSTSPRSGPARPRPTCSPRSAPTWSRSSRSSVPTACATRPPPPAPSSGGNGAPCSTAPTRASAASPSP